MSDQPSETCPSPPRVPPAEWSELPHEGYVEEEGFAWYHPEKWYSIRIGDIFESKYQVLLKLGFGSVSTAWLCRDLREHKYVTLKVYETGHRQALNEYKVLQHLKDIKSDHPGAEFVRLALDTFELPGKTGPHVCLIHEPLSLSFTNLREIAGGKLPLYVVKPMLHGVLRALDYLHSVAHVVHTDLQEGNIMLSVTDPSIFDQVLAEEWSSPMYRKSTHDRVIHVSTEIDIPDDPGLPIITDFGDAKIGDGPFTGEVMPDLYRAPEIILGIPWDNKIDIWALGLMIWDMVQGKHLFNERLPSRDASAGPHLAMIISLLGAPPPELLQKGGFTEFYFDENGQFRNPGSVSKASLEDEEDTLEGEEKTLFLAFIRRMLQWRPVDRPTALELVSDPWLELKAVEESLGDDEAITTAKS